MQSLTDKLYGITDGYYYGSEDYKLIHQILEELEFLKKTNRLSYPRMTRLRELLERTK